MKRIPELDGLRAIAIILVIGWHYVSGLGLTATPIGQAFRLGWSGVDLFFVISGYLIGGILLDARESANYFRVFYGRRAFRILPLYGLTVAGCLLVFRVDTSPLPAWSYAVFGQNVFNAITGNWGSHWLNPTWSLAVEEQFYLTLPLIVRFAPVRALPWLAGAGVIAAPILRAACSSHMASYTLMPCRLDCLGMGVLLMFAMRHNAARAFLAEWSLPACVVFGFRYLLVRTPNEQVMDPLWVCLFWSAVVAFALTHTGKRFSRLLNSTPMQHVGKYSYSIYLFHQPTFILIGAIAAGPALVIFAALTTFSLARLSWLYLEYPLIQIGHKFRYDWSHPNNVAPHRYVVDSL